MTQRIESHAASEFVAICVNACFRQCPEMAGAGRRQLATYQSLGQWTAPIGCSAANLVANLTRSSQPQTQGRESSARDQLGSINSRQTKRHVTLTRGWRGQHLTSPSRDLQQLRSYIQIDGRSFGGALGTREGRDPLAVHKQEWADPKSRAARLRSLRRLPWCLQSQAYASGEDAWPGIVKRLCFCHKHRPRFKAPLAW